ncbi:MAG: hypothetical protein M3N54_06085 [Acidobacteriota bacterium]|nr:hypothetical protein [Acidobacteriota bacterium]
MKFASCTALLSIALVGCSNSNVDSQEAVKQGVIRDISKNVNVSAMDVNVVSVRFRDKEADAVVSFAPKGVSASQGLTMSYTLARQGTEWHIVKRAQSDVQKHAAQAQAPAAGPTDGTQLPPGHPPMNGSPQQ